ncbi:cache domain-containing protein [Thauera sp. CAU 1555]|uniref:Cache domain-containing protein n=1 Tax=Thauera sedimentorum TaxID=2767595 RepID=A0ABR9B8S9_9RHOO|nr:cache domain-containing protein [Thauera sedimentorum]MBC9071728.1 cache domain-containing protein [Thauera sedimentorum]MBD8502647.1 cache domain-containing protein [Thauera sedimentorum]
MKRVFQSKAVFATLLAAGLALPAAAVDRATPREARSLFEQAVQYMQENGAERAFAAFNNQKGKFVRKDLYVFVIDDKGVYHASGAAPEALVGLTVLNTTDAAGNPLFREMIDSTRRTQEATVRYMWLNRVTNKVEPKVSYVRKVGSYVLGVGYSAPRASADDARAMLERAVAFAGAEGVGKAAEAFNDRGGEFVKDDLYVFMVDLASGRFQAMGMNPALADTDALGLHDAAGHALVAEMVEKLKGADEASVDYVWRNPVTNAVEKKRSYVRKVGGSLIGVGHYLE